MTSPCFNCRYASREVSYCGKALPMHCYTECSGYVEGPDLGCIKLVPGCRFPVTEKTTVLHLDLDRYYVVTSNKLLSYMIVRLCSIPAHLSSIEKNITIELTGSTYIDCQVSIVTKIGIGVPETLWWLDTTLSYEEAIPMYALLLAIDDMYSHFSSSTKLTVLKAVLTVGNQLKGRPIKDWDTTILNGPSFQLGDLRSPSFPTKVHQRQLVSYSAAPPLSDTCPQVAYYTETRLWGKDTHEVWLAWVNKIHKWLDNYH